MSVNKGRNWKMLYFSILTFEKDQFFNLHEHRSGAEGEPVKYY